MLLAASLLFAANLPIADVPMPRTVVAVPQESGRVPNKPGGSLPSGGTPEPTGLLLLVGGAIGVGAYLAKQRKGDAPKE